MTFFALVSEVGFDVSVGVSFKAVIGVPASDWGRGGTAGGCRSAVVFGIVETGVVPSWLLDLV